MAEVNKVNPVISENRPISIIDQNGQWYIVGADGKALPGAEEPHVSREEAEAHLKALMNDDKPFEPNVGEENPIAPPPQNEGVEKVDETVAGQPKTIFIPLAKVDQAKHEVWGYAAIEQEDHAGETLDYESSKPLWKDWSEGLKKLTGGKSLGRLRGMHKAIAAGKLIAMIFDDANKGFWIGAKVVDKDEWEKVDEGVYTGFSVGGLYLRRWRDFQKNTVRYTAKPEEISLVDAPCIPGATFQVIKVDGATENRPLVSGDGTHVLKSEIPESPEPVNSGDAPDGGNLEEMHDMDKPKEITPESIPSGDELASQHTGVTEITTAVAEISSAAEPTQNPDVEKVDQPAAEDNSAVAKIDMTTMAVTIKTTPEVAERFTRFLALLKHASDIGHSNIFGMSLDGDGADRFDVEGVDLPKVEDGDIQAYENFEVMKVDLPRPEIKLVKVVTHDLYQSHHKKLIKVKPREDQSIRKSRMVKVV